MKDILQRFIFENFPVRGELVHLDATYQAVLEKHDYPPRVQKVLGELMAAVSLLIATLKFRGRLIAQVQGNGPVNLLVVEGSSDKTLRAMASFKDAIPDDTALDSLFGDARLVITLEPEKGERYQGIVLLEGENLAGALSDYLVRSEQLDTELWLFANDRIAAGLLIQKLPASTKEKSNIISFSDIEAWNRIQQLSATITEDELLRLDAATIIHRLYHEEDVRVFEEEYISFRCSCSHERVANMLRSLGEDEVNDMIRELGSIEVACEFCNHKYHFDAVDAGQLFTSSLPHNPPATEQ